MNNFQITDEQIYRAFKAAKSDEAKTILKAFFPNVVNKPNIDDYKSIKNYEDACEVLGEKPILNDVCGICGYEDDGERVSYPYLMDMPKHIIALMKLEVISKALWGKNFKPKINAESKYEYFYPWKALYSKKDIEDLNPNDKSKFSLVNEEDKKNSYFGSIITMSRLSDSSECISFRLCQETKEKALYFGQQFYELWKEYLILTDYK